MGAKGTKRHLALQSAAALSVLLEQAQASAPEIAALCSLPVHRVGYLLAQAVEWGRAERVTKAVYRALPELADDVAMWGGLDVVRRWRTLPVHDARKAPSALAWRHMRAIVTAGAEASNERIAEVTGDTLAHIRAMTKIHVYQGWIEPTFPPHTRPQFYRLSPRGREWYTLLTEGPA